MPVVLLAWVPLVRSFGLDCPPHPLPAVTAPNIFSKEQEIQLGNHLAQQFTRSLAVTDDPEVTGYLSDITVRLLKGSPRADLNVRVLVVDSPVPNAFTFAGGRIYVTRGLAKFVRNEDELAGILAHELGHALTHQSAVSLTALLKQVLAVTSVKDEQDIIVDLNRLDESWGQNPAAFRRIVRSGDDDQEVADRVALALLANAGYSAQASVDIFGRISETTGKSGNWLTDLFGLTSPDQRRMRELLKRTGAFSAACASKAPLAAGFERWRSALLDFSAWDRRRERLANVVSKIKLDPIVLREIGQLRFSPNGNYALARESDRILLFTREPFAFGFQIDAPHVVDSRFTADSSSIAFASSGGRVEIWDLASRRRMQAFDLLERNCVDAIVSPDAKHSACIAGDGTLTVVELSSNASLFKEHFDKFGPYNFAQPPFIDFSPDGHYFAVEQDFHVVIFDLVKSKRVNLPPALNGNMASGFAFTGEDRIVTFPGAWNRSAPQFTTLTFPAGKVLGNFAVSPGTLFSRISPAANGDFVLLRPWGKYGVAAVNLKDKKLLVARQSPLDLYRDIYVRPLDDGGLGLFDLKAQRLRSRVDIPVPQSGDGRFQRAFISPNLRWVAGCGPERCGLWNAETGKRILLLRLFNAAWFDSSGAFYADFPKNEKMARTLARMDPENGEVTSTRQVDDEKAWLRGRFLITLQSANNRAMTFASGNDLAALAARTVGQLLGPCAPKLADDVLMACDVTFEVHDAPSGRELWSRHFPREGPVVRIEPDQDLVLFKWPVSAETAKEEMKGSQELSERLAAAGPKLQLDLLEIASAADGSVQRKLLLEPGLPLSMIGDRLIIQHRDYFEIQSLADGHIEGKIFGSLRAYSNSDELVAVDEKSDSDLAIYDLKTRNRIESLSFPGTIATARFGSARQLLVLTNSQMQYTFRIPSDSQHASSPTLQ
ncbi:MAG: M48 family metalloprotease [Acidobacteriaceae bacterium]|nr:M48 family metalloprotease [Acidobacteriaceae bacterium]MBV9500495.1 M48 family metalloprotease [Acidobacteriaceae bacterium]